MALEACSVTGQVTYFVYVNGPADKRLYAGKARTAEDARILERGEKATINGSVRNGVVVPESKKTFEELLTPWVQRSGSFDSQARLRRQVAAEEDLILLLGQLTPSEITVAKVKALLQHLRRGYGEDHHACVHTAPGAVPRREGRVRERSSIKSHLPLGPSHQTTVQASTTIRARHLPENQGRDSKRLPSTFPTRRPEPCSRSAIRRPADGRDPRLRLEDIDPWAPDLGAPELRDHHQGRGAKNRARHGHAAPILAG